MAVLIQNGNSVIELPADTHIVTFELGRSNPDDDHLIVGFLAEGNGDIASVINTLTGSFNYHHEVEAFGDIVGREFVCSGMTDVTPYSLKQPSLGCYLFAFSVQSYQ